MLDTTQEKMTETELRDAILKSLGGERAPLDMASIISKAEQKIKTPQHA